jgi:ubiquinol-cytochrome c reductase cytochrome b subunit
MSFSWAQQYQPTNPFMKYMDEKLPVPRLLYNAIGAGYPVPRNFNWWYNFGVLAGAALAIQLITGIVLAMHFAANAGVAFDSVEHIMRDVMPMPTARRCSSSSSIFIFSGGCFTVLTKHHAKWCGCLAS